MNQASDMLVIQSLAFFGKKLLFLGKTLKMITFWMALKQNKTK